MTCKKPNSCEFQSFGKGFSAFCSLDCSSKSKELAKIKIGRAKDILLEKYGVDNASKIAGHGDRVKKTKFKRHGDENYVNVEKSKETNNKRYGVDFYMQTDEYRASIKQTSQELYGVDHFTQAESVKQKARETSLGKHDKSQLRSCLGLWKSKVRNAI